MFISCSNLQSGIVLYGKISLGKKCLLGLGIGLEEISLGRMSSKKVLHLSDNGEQGRADILPCGGINNSHFSVLRVL